jgi:hypothetical protein
MPSGAYDEEHYNAWKFEIGSGIPDGSRSDIERRETESSDDRSFDSENSDGIMVRESDTSDGAGRNRICGLSKPIFCMLVAILVLGGGLGTLAYAVSQRSRSTANTDAGSSVPTSAPSNSVSKKPVPTSAPSNSIFKPNESAEHCGCLDCTAEIWSTLANGNSCGDRINYLAKDTSKYPTEIDACRIVANVEFPTVCGPGCNPDRCDGRITPFTTAPTLAPHTPPLTPESSLSCFPEYSQRTRYENVWGKYTVEVKEGTSCGPGDNKFTTNTVSVNNDELTLQFKKGDDGWEASEVRVILPEEEMPYTYGTYSFSVKTVSVLDAETSTVIDTVLPQSLVLGLFTWDDTEIFDIHENWNHEVDVEISRWNIPGNPDAQFLVQPPEDQQLLRFYSGAGSVYEQGGHIYEFTWNPGKVEWYTDAAGGKDHSYATEDALFAGLNDYVQCLPADVEIRMNLWNMFGNVLPVGMLDNQVVEVVIDDFYFTPSNSEYVVDGGYCTKHCHCGPSSLCLNGICTEQL